MSKCSQKNSQLGLCMYENPDGFCMYIQRLFLGFPQPPCIFKNKKRTGKSPSLFYFSFFKTSFALVTASLNSCREPL